MDLLLDDSGDLDFSSGTLELVDGIDAVKQNLILRYSLFKGEWFLNPLAGVPYFQTILVKNPAMTVVRSILRKVADTTEGVSAVNNFQATLDGAIRKLSVAFQATYAGDGTIFTFDEDFVL